MDDVQKLLDAEQAAQTLLVSLQGLKSEMDGFADAKSSLREAVGHLRAFVESTRMVAAAAAESVETLKSLGMPEVLARTAALGGMLEGLAQSVQTRCDAMSADIQRGSQTAAGDLSKQIGTSMTALREAVEALLRDAHNQSLALVERLGQQSRAQSAQESSAIQTRLDGMQETVRQIVVASLDSAVQTQNAKAEEFSARLDRMQSAVQQVVTASLASAAESQGARMNEFGGQWRKVLIDSAQDTKGEVTSKVAAVSLAQDASHKAIARLGRIIIIQSVLIGVLIVTTAVVVVVHFAGGK